MIRALRVLAAIQLLIVLLAALVVVVTLSDQSNTGFGDYLLLALGLVSPTLTAMITIAVAHILEQLDWLVSWNYGNAPTSAKMTMPPPA